MDDRRSGARGDASRDDYPDLVRANTQRTVLDAVGAGVLESVVADLLAALETAVTVFEANGDYATGARPRGWCALMDELSRPQSGEGAAAIDAGQWSCRASCRRPALDAMQSGAAAEYECPGGMHVHAIPIRAGGKIVGSISVGYGGPPSDPARLEALAQELRVPLQRLRDEAARARSPKPEAVEAAVRGVEATARLLGALVEQRKASADREHARDLFIGMLAHDLRNPLASILMSARALLSSSARPERGAQTAERITKSARIMDRLIEDVLDLTRSRAGGGVPLKLAPCALDRLCDEVADEVRAADPARVIALSSSGDATMSCDAERVREVLTNLLVNAFRHGDGGVVDLSARGAPDAVVLTVHNGGNPIPADVLPRIFDPFAKGKPAEGGRKRGLGLGLYIAREIVRAHGGTIDVASDEASGTTFRVRLPRR